MLYSALAGVLSTHFVQLSITILLVLLISILTLRRWPRLTFLLCLLGVLKCLVPPLLTSPFAFFTLHESLAHHTARAVQDPSQDDSPAASQASRTDPFVSDRKETDAGLSSGVASEWSWQGLRGFPLVRQTLGGIWLSGSLVLCGLAWRRWHSLKLAIRRSDCAVPDGIRIAVDEISAQLRVTRVVKVVIGSEEWGPAVVGVVQPILLLPESLLDDDPAVVRPVIAHELSHVRRWDTMWGLLQFVAQVVWWFHPAVWLMSRRTTEVCERCCDADVLENMGITPSAYAAGLVRVLQLRQRASVAPFLRQMSVQGITAQRLHDLQHYRPSGSRSIAARWGMAMMLAAFVLPGGAWREGSLPRGVSNEEKAGTVQISTAAVRTAIQSADWPTAVRLLSAVVSTNDRNGEAWFFLGYSLHMAGQLQRAIPAHARAAEFDTFRGTALYNWACALARLQQQEAAIAKLTQSADSGFLARQDIATDPDLQDLRQHPEFEALRKRLSRPDTAPVYRELDFLIGSWDVLNAAGERTARTTITTDEDGFLIREKWEHVTGDSGTGISFYDPGNRVWKQTWVDTDGRVIEYSGDAGDGEIRMLGYVRNRNGESRLSRLILESKTSDLVARRVENSDDDGVSWTLQFKGTFRRTRS